MKLFIIDHLGNRKTVHEIETWFNAQGHEVRVDTYYDPVLVQWSDVTFFAWAEGMVNNVLNDGWNQQQIEKKIWDYGNRKEEYVVGKKPFYVWATDIEIWGRQGVGIDWSKITGVFYMNPALFDYLDKEVDFKNNYPNVKLRHLPLSVDMSKWTYKERKPGKNIAVIGEMWMAKNPFMITQMMTMLPDDYHVYILGRWNQGVWRWAEEQFWYEVKEYGLEGRVHNDSYVDDVNVWLEDKNYLVTFSAKDAFSIPVAEAMAKGIKAIPHNFLGSKYVWPEYTWNSLPELIKEITTSEYNSKEYRDYVENKYSNDIVLKQLEKELQK